MLWDYSSYKMECQLMLFTLQFSNVTWFNLKCFSLNLKVPYFDGHWSSRRKKYLKSCFLLLLRFVVMLFCCENQFSFTKKSVCTWLTEQPLSQWMMAIIIKREDFSKQEWFACKRQEQRRERSRKKTDFLPCSSLFIQRPNIP